MHPRRARSQAARSRLPKSPSALEPPALARKPRPCGAAALYAGVRAAVAAKPAPTQALSVLRNPCGMERRLKSFHVFSAAVAALRINIDVLTALHTLPFAERCATSQPAGM